MNQSRIPKFANFLMALEKVEFLKHKPVGTQVLTYFSHVVMELRLYPSFYAQCEYGNNLPSLRFFC